MEISMDRSQNKQKLMLNFQIKFYMAQTLAQDEVWATDWQGRPSTEHEPRTCDFTNLIFSNVEFEISNQKFIMWTGDHLAPAQGPKLAIQMM